MTELAVHDELDGSASPPGRESREDWRGGQNRRNGRSPSSGEKPERSRSRSPRASRFRKRSYSPGREMRYTREGTNTTSREPHLERARLFVGNIEPNRTHRRDIIKLFSQYGDVLGVSVHKGYAFVQMDRERTANKAINFEDNHTFMGSKIHVEFSQAALRAGAKFERLPASPPPPRERPSFAPPPMPDPYLLEEQERQREARLARILQMEREIALLRDSSGAGLDSRRSRLQDPHDSYDRRDRDGYRRSPPPPINSHGYDSYDRHDREPGPYRGGGSGSGGGGGVDRVGGMGGGGGGRGYYGRPSSPRDHPSRGGSSSEGVFRDAVSYPSQYSSGGGGSSAFSGRSPPTVGYSTSGLGGKSSGLPPGWPSSDHDKSSMNRAPFTTKGPWS